MKSARGCGIGFIRSAESDERGAGKATFATARYASGVLNASATTLHWQLIDSEAGTVLDETSLAAPAAARRAAPTVVEAA